MSTKQADPALGDQHRCQLCPAELPFAGRYTKVCFVDKDETALAVLALVAGVVHRF